MVQQTPWLDRSFQFGFPTGLFPVIFSRLEGGIFRLHHLLASADDEFCGHQSGAWSVKEHLGHLTDLESLWWNRLTDFKENKPVLTAADMNNSKTYEALHNEKSLEELLNAFVVERQKMLETVYYFDEEMLNRTALHPRLNQPMRVIDALYFVAEHDDHHITIISTMLRKPIGS